MSVDPAQHARCEGCGTVMEDAPLSAEIVPDICGDCAKRPSIFERVDDLKRQVAALSAALDEKDAALREADARARDVWEREGDLIARCERLRGEAVLEQDAHDENVAVRIPIEEWRYLNLAPSLSPAALAVSSGQPANTKTQQ